MNWIIRTATLSGALSLVYSCVFQNNFKKVSVCNVEYRDCNESPNLCKMCYHRHLCYRRMPSTSTPTLSFGYFKFIIGLHLVSFT